MFVHNINPVLLQLGPFGIRYYGLVYALGFLIVTHIVVKEVEKGKLKQLNKESTIDLMMGIMLAIVIGARILHVFTAFNHYMNPFFIELKLFSFSIPIPSMLAVWNGGMAFFGGFIGVMLYGYFYCKNKKINFVELADIVIYPIPLVIGIGRIANFINAEHIGPITSLPWAVQFPGFEGFRHPTQLYEALTMFTLFFILHIIKNKKSKKIKTGTLLPVFMFFYGIFRFHTEFFRINMLTFGILTDAQWLCILLVICSIYFFKKIYNLKNPKLKIITH